MALAPAAVDVTQRNVKTAVVQAVKEADSGADQRLVGSAAAPSVKVIATTTRIAVEEFEMEVVIEFVVVAAIEVVLEFETVIVMEASAFAGEILYYAKEIQV